MSGIFQGYTNPNGRVRAAVVSKVPAGSANDRGMIVAGNRVIPYELDSGQPRTFHDGIAFNQVTGLLLAAETPFGPTNISMGGLLVDSRGAVMLTNGNPQVIHQGVGLQNNGRLSIESEPIATFIANLSNNVASTTGPGDFERDSDGLYRGADGVWRIAGANQPRFENGHLLMEPAITNKCENWNMHPDEVLTGVIKSGDPNAILHRVLDPSGLESAGLSNLGNGYVIELDNRTGTATASATLVGVVGNLNTHTGSGWVYVLNQGAFCDMRFDAANQLTLTNTIMQRQRVTGTPSGTGSALQFRCGAGGRLRFILNQLEESSAVTSPIITQGASGSRAVDALGYVGVDQFFNQTEGMAFCTVKFRFDPEDIQAYRQEGILSLRETSSTSVMRYVRTASNTNSFQSNQETGSTAYVGVSNIQKGNKVLVATRWSVAANELQIGAKKESEAWSWSAVQAYGGAFMVSDNSLYLGNESNYSFGFQDAVIYDEDMGRDWIEANWP